MGGSIQEDDMAATAKRDGRSNARETRDTMKKAVSDDLLLDHIMRQACFMGPLFWTDDNKPLRQEALRLILKKGRRPRPRRKK